MSKLLSKNSKKRTIIAVSALGVIGLIGLTFAVSQDHTFFSNNFKLAGYQTLFTETFDAPQNWKTCETVDKTITATNDTDSSSPVSIRIKLEEQWLAADGTTELPLVSAASGLTMAQINFTPNSGWTQNGNYYYYDTDLAKGATTSSLITGVTLNCNANLSVTEPGSDGAYADGTYHLKITTQAIEAESKDQWGRTLYNVITSRENNGVDNNIDFTRGAIKDQADSNGAGINIRSGTENDNYPIYYFRGNIDDNFVVWGDFCWRVVRTTDTGGTKMIYHGTKENTGGNVTCSQSSSGMTYNSSNTFKYSDFVDIAASGYMYGDATVSRKYLKSEGIDDNTSITIANRVNYSNGQYELIDTVSGVWSSIYRNAFSDHKYICLDGTTSVCNRVGFIQTESSSSITYARFFDITGYANMDDFVSQKITSNENSSVAKQNIDGWFEQNLIHKESDLEDTVFCNDRYMTPYQETGNYNSLSDVHIRNDNSRPSVFAPTLECKRKDDSFTKDDIVRGNGDLSHSIGLITADELTFSGLLEYGNSSSQGAFIGSPYAATMSPADTYAGYILRFTTSSYHEQYPMTTISMRPVVSLKNSVEIKVGGAGTRDNPYVIE